MRGLYWVLLTAILAGFCGGPIRGADKKKLKPLSAAEVFKRAAPAIVAIDCLGANNSKLGGASGFLVSSNGKIVTNLHVIQQCSGVAVHLTNGDIYDTANVIEVDGRKDLAIIRIKAVSLPTLTLGDSNDVEIGQSIYSIGTPSGLQNTLQQGLISAIRQLPGLRVLQVSASINPGNSGGPILDDQAHVIGVAAAKVTTAENLGFAIPIDYAKGLLESSNEVPFATFVAAMRQAMANNAAKAGMAPPPPPAGGAGGTTLPKFPSGPPQAAAPLAFRSIEAFAGREWKFEAEGAPALQAALGHLRGVALDRAGNIYLSDAGNQAILKVDTSGTVHVLLGPASPPQSRPINPQGIAVDSSGVVYFAEDGQRVRKILPTGEVAVVAGNDKRGMSSDGAVAAGASIGNVNGVAVASDGSVLFSEFSNNRVRRVDKNGMLQTVAGDGQTRFSGDGGPAREASFVRPMDLALDAEGNLFIADEYNARIRKVDKDGVISTVAGEGVTKDPLGCPTGVAVNGQGDLFIADPCKRRVFKVHKGESSVLGGTGPGRREPIGEGGPAAAASFDCWALAVNGQDDVIVAGPDTGYLYRISHDGTLSILAGSGNWRAPTDGMQAVNALFQQPQRLAVEPNGAVLVADLDANRIYRVDTRGVISRVAGFPTAFYNGERAVAGEAGIDRPMGIRVRPNGAIVFAERGNANRILEITPDGKTHTLAGNGRRDYSGDGGRAANASLNAPLGICLDSSGAIYVADTGNHRVRKVLPDGTIQLVAGNGTAGFSGDGGPAERAALSTPLAVDIGPDGSLYIADAGNRRVRKVSSPGGVITTVAGDGMNRFAGDGGPAVNASIGWPYDVAVGPDQALYIVDIGTERIRRVDPVTGIITSVAGNGNRDISGDGGAPAQAALGHMGGLAFDSAGNLFFAEAGEGRIRVLRVSSAPGQAAPIGGVAPAAQPMMASNPAIQISTDKLETFLRSKIGVWTADDARTILGAVRDQRQDSRGVLLRFDTPQTSFSSASLHFDTAGKLSSVDMNPARNVTWSAQLAYMKAKFPGEQFQVEQNGDNVIYTFPQSRAAFTVAPDGSVVSAAIF